MLGVGLPEIAVILVVAVVVFGPDRLPEFARQAGRLVRQLRQFAQSTQDELRRELGPEYADLKLSDLDPRQAIRKHIIDAMDEPLPQTQPTSIVHEELAAGETPPYDTDAT